MSEPTQQTAAKAFSLGRVFLNEKQTDGLERVAAILGVDPQTYIESIAFGAVRDFLSKIDPIS